VKRVLLLLAALLAPCAALAQTYDVLDVPIQSLSNSAQTVKSVPAPLLFYECYNPNATLAWLQVFDVAGAVTVGTTPPTFNVQLQPGQSTGLARPPTSTGAYFAANSIKVAATTTAGGGTAPATAVPCDFGTR
jgi:hypothetical protein